MLKYLEVKCLPLTSRWYMDGWIDRQTGTQIDREIEQYCKMLTFVDSRVECIFMLFFELFNMFKIFIINS